MALLKDEVNMRLDQVGLAATEALELYRSLKEDIEEPALLALLEEHIGQQEQCIEALDDLRRQRGDLPQAADPERSGLGAAGAFLRAHILPGESSTHYAESLLNAAERVAAELREARALDIEASLQRVLETLQKNNEAFETKLRRFV